MNQADLVKAIELFKIQGFKTPEEMFVVGYLMAHGGEAYWLEQTGHDLELLARDADFWLPHIRDDHKIHMKVLDEDISNANSLLRTYLETRNAEVPKWLKEKE